MKDILDLITLATNLSSSKVNDRWNHSPVGQEKSLSPSETPEPLSNEVAVSADQHSKDSPPVRINKDQKAFHINSNIYCNNKLNTST